MAKTHDTHAPDNQIREGATRFSDQVLEKAKGQYPRLVVIGITEEGVLQVASTSGAPEALWMIEKSKSIILWS